MSQGYVNPVELRNKARELFISKRSIQEQNFNKWYASLLKCPKEQVLDKIPFDYTNMSLQSLVPEWYAEVPRAEVCTEQVARANEKIDTINQIIDSINREGVALLEEYNKLYSG